MNAKEIKIELANKLNYKFNEKFKIVFGSTDGYTSIINPFNNYETSYIITFCVTKDGNALNKNDFVALRKSTPLIVNMNVNNNRLIVWVKNGKNEDKINKIIETNKLVIEYLKNNGYNNMDEITRELTATNIYNIQGTPQFVSAVTFERFKIENPAQQTVIQPEENVGKGIIGGILGSILGAASIVLFGKLGFIAALSGFVMGACTILGYKKMAGCISKKGIIISIIIMAIMTYIGVRTSAALVVQEELSKYYRNVDFFKVFEGLSDFVKLDSNLYGAYMRDIVLTYVFTAGGAYGVIKGKLYEVKNENVFEEL